MNNIPYLTLLSAATLACVCPAFAQEEVKAPESLDGASIRIKTTDEKEIFCDAKDLNIVLYTPQGNTAQLIFTHSAGTCPQKIRYEKLSGDESYDAKENKGTPALLTFTDVKGYVYHVSVEGYWTSDHSHDVAPVQSMEIIFPPNVSIHGDKECIEILPDMEELEEPQHS